MISCDTFCRELDRELVIRGITDVSEGTMRHYYRQRYTILEAMRSIMRGREVSAKLQPIAERV